jgi:hypothetical protein
MMQSDSFILMVQRSFIMCEARNVVHFYEARLKVIYVK